MSDLYFEKYEVHQRWEQTANVDNLAAKKFKFPAQPAENGADCGAFVLMYMWAIATGQECRRLPPDPNTVADYMNRIRMEVGSFLVTQF